MFDQIQWTQIAIAAITVGGSLTVGRWAWSKLPKKDIGAAAFASVQAAQEAVQLMDVVMDARLEQLEERVTVLEELVVEKENKIRLLEAEIKRLLRWIAVLVEQVHKSGEVPITLEEIEHYDPEES